MSSGTTRFEIRDAQGKLIAVHVRRDRDVGMKDVWWERPDGRSGLDGMPTSRLPLYGSEEVASWGEAEPVIITEGEKARDALKQHGFHAVATVTGAAGCPDAESLTVLRGREVILWADADAPGRNHMRKLAARLKGIALSCKVFLWPDAPDHGDAADYLDSPDAAHFLRMALKAALPGPRCLIEQTPIAAAEAEAPAPSVGGLLDRPDLAPLSLSGVVAAFKRWLYLEDLAPLLVILAVVAANLYLPGDPVWMLLVGASGGGKTEILRAMTTLPRARLAATLTEASLLSGSPKRDHHKDSSGGLLREVGERGVIVFKDFTSILSMNRDARAQVLAALREIFDGEWTRHVGTDGGRTLSWSGHVGVIAGCTPTIDRHHGVTASLGERFVMLRLGVWDRRELARRALGHKGAETAMRTELAATVARLYAGLNTAPPAMTDAERERLVSMADFAARARSAVERDGYNREIELIPDPEAPTRIALTLGRLRDGLIAIGLPANTAMRLVSRVALDSIPALRLGALNALRVDREKHDTTELAVSLGHPTGTVRRVLEDLEGHGLVERHSGGRGNAHKWLLHEDIRREMGTLPEMSSFTEKEIIEAVGGVSVSVNGQAASEHADISGKVEGEPISGPAEPAAFVDDLLGGAP